MTSYVFFFSIVEILLCLIRPCSLIDVPHGTFASIRLPNGRSQVTFYGIPTGSGFAVLQLHTPFNRILVSISPYFDYWSSQSCSHCGLSLVLHNTTENVTLHTYSSHDTFLSGWARIDGYPSEYPWPGGCDSKFNNLADATITYGIAKLPDSLGNSKGTFTNLKYWTSTLSFTLATPSVTSQQPFSCNNSLIPQADIVYYIYTRPLVIAGALHGTYSNPSPIQAAEVLRSLSSVDSVLGKPYYKLKISPSSITKNFNVQIPVARKPGTAYVILVVVEYQSAGSSLRVAYSPSILYGCPGQQKVTGNIVRRGYVPVHDVSSQLNCNLLPSESPALYFLAAVVLLGSLCYGCACHWWIWPRCAVALMVISSLFGSLLCLRYNTAYNDAILILVVAAVLPGILAVLLFTVIWCTCIRPTLYYHRAFGRGPLIKVPVREESSDNPVTAAENRQPWTHYPLADSEHFEHPVAFDLGEIRPYYPEEEPTPCHVDFAGTAVHGSSSLQTLVNSETATVSGDTEPAGATVRRRWWWSGKSKRSNQLFTLRPRRLARLPPILPAAFILVAYLTYLTGETFLLTDSITSYLAFVVCISVVILALFCVFKNFAFGLATALVGFYLSLSCACLFLVPNAVFPQILIEQFLRLAWVEHRLSALNLHSFGLYDILLQVAWLVLSLVMGLVTLCMIRLRDARELSVATRIQLQSDVPVTSQQTLAASTGVLPGGDDQHLPVGGMSTSGSTSGPFHFWERVALTFSSLNSAGAGTAPPDTASLSNADSGAVGRPVGGELQPLLANLYRRPNYGGFSTGLPLTAAGAVTSLSMAPNTQSLVPLSRVQLRTCRLRSTDSVSRLCSPPGP